MDTPPYENPYRHLTNWQLRRLARKLSRKIVSYNQYPTLQGQFISNLKTVQDEIARRKRYDLMGY